MTQLPTVLNYSLFSTSSPTLFSVFNNSHSNRCEVISHLVLICISLRINDVDHFVMYLLVICIIFFEKKCWLIYSFYFLNLIVCFLLLSLLSSLYILDISPLWFANILCQSVGCAFMLLVVICAEAFLVCYILLVHFPFCCFNFWCHIKKKSHHQDLGQGVYHLHFFLVF